MLNRGATEAKSPISLGKCYFALWFKIFTLRFTFMKHMEEYRSCILRMVSACLVISLLVELVGYVYIIGSARGVTDSRPVSTTLCVMGWGLTS